MKKLLFAANTLELGGIERALVNLLNYLANLNKYKIVLVLEKKQGIFLNELNNKIEIIEYTPNKSKLVIIRKIINALKRIGFICRYKNRFDFSASFATYSKMSSFVARVASSNNVLWGHADYLELYGDKEKVKDFFNSLHYEKFKKIIFVSEEGKKSFDNIFPNMKDKLMVCNNLIDKGKIEKLANEHIELEKPKKTVFLNVGRHDEKQKKLSRIIEAAKMLKEKNYNFKILFVGDGPDCDKYKEEVRKKGLEEYILFMGKQQNPYPYFLISDVVVLASDYEGYPVVFLESMVLNKPIITTDISGSKTISSGGFGVVTTKNTEAIYNAMENFIKNGYTPNKMDIDAYNKDIEEKLIKIIEGR